MPGKFKMVVMSDYSQLSISKKMFAPLLYLPESALSPVYTYSWITWLFPPAPLVFYCMLCISNSLSPSSWLCLREISSFHLWCKAEMAFSCSFSIKLPHYFRHYQHLSLLHQTSLNLWRNCHIVTSRKENQYYVAVHYNFHYFL